MYLGSQNYTRYYFNEFRKSPVNMMKNFLKIQEVIWPSGLMRRFKALIRKGAGSNPVITILHFPDFFHCFLQIK
ncbi:MAG: hypothetical protein LBC61_02380 [Candidatus Peribacteria bacterium]|nr:hypothetical protein [Candidatus Peribacteria bacterium]